MKRKRKLNKKKILFVLLIIFLVLYWYTKYKYSSLDYISNYSNPNTISNYKIIKQDYNSNYLGIGQKEITNKDGYFTTFTTIDNHQKTYKEYKQNGNSSWSEKEYWGRYYG